MNSPERPSDEPARSHRPDAADGLLGRTDLSSDELLAYAHDYRTSSAHLRLITATFEYELQSGYLPRNDQTAEDLAAIYRLKTLAEDSDRPRGW